ncbi:MAG TPA: cation diffusion facilitator family transporter [bacterium]|nr:cation diffusion facilitator family transporter [bacterium]
MTASQAAHPLSHRTAAIRRVLWVVLALNLAVAVAKLAIGYSVDSLGMVADGFHSVMDGSSNVIGLVGMYLASRPPDLDHPYGHHKYESFSALAIALLLGLTALEVVRAGITRLGSAEHAKPTALAFAVMVATMVVNALVTHYESRQGRFHKSEVLVADAGHTRSDIFVSLSVLVGLGAAWMQVYWLDALVAFAIAVLIVRIAWQILVRGTSTLMDTTMLKPEEIAAVVDAVPGVRSSSHIRSRGEPPNLFIDLEIQLDPETPLREAHRIAHEVREACLRAFEATDTVVHMEPDEGPRV